MEIKLKNIGIVNNSTIVLNGLTVITGKNNSGKTTVGKALYSIIDAVSDITTKAEKDREQYIYNKLNDVEEVLGIFRYLQFAYIENQQNLEVKPSHFPKIFLLLSREYSQEITKNNILDFARDLYDELTNLDTKTLSQELNKIKNGKVYIKHITRNTNTEEDINTVIIEHINSATQILNDLFQALKNDPQLIEYARESINQTLNMEFSGQIQPVSVEVNKSKIELYSEKSRYFDINITNNKVLKDGNPVFFTSPYKKAFFIDNPFVLDAPTLIQRLNRRIINDVSENLINPNSILPHNQRLRQTLRQANQPTVLEQTIINDSLEKIATQINSIIPGSFEFSVNGDYYIQENGSKLKFANLATGSKMFSIIKILTEKGELDKNTMLILDEPEAHLHPSWQNKFAEMIVLLVKELKVNILLTTHSSNFVLALDACMRKYEIEEITNFYQTEFQGNMADYKCVNEDIGAIYKDFLNYLSEVKVLRDKYLRSEDDEV